MTEEEFTELINGKSDVNKHYNLMKKFFKKCLYTTLENTPIDDQKRYLFINIIYNGFKAEYLKNWYSEIIPETVNAINKGIKEKKLREDLNNLLINNDSKSSESENSESVYSKFINDLINKWCGNEEKSSAYYEEIKQETNYRYIIIGEDAPWSGAYLLGDSEDDKKGPYYNSLKSAFNDKNIVELSDGFKKQKVLFFDLLTIPLPINSNLRKKWSTDNKNFKIGDKQLPVFLLEVAFEHFDLKDKINDAKIAIMMPTKTSSSIYNYFEQITKEDGFHCLKDRLTAKSCWNEINDYHQTIITNGKCFNYYKSNTISGSNTPDVDLLEYALNITHETIKN